MQHFVTDRRFNMRFIVLASLIALVVWLLLRIGLWVQVGIGQLGFGESLRMLGKGLWFDVATLCYVTVPFLLIPAFIPSRFSTSPMLGRLRWFGIFLVIFLLLFGAASEAIFWQEFTTRFNFIAVDYLVYTHEVVGNILESYPVGAIILAIAGAALLVSWLLSRFVRLDNTPFIGKQKTGAIVLAILLPVLSFILADTGQMAYSKNAYATELSGNGLFTFASAMRSNSLDYDKFYKTIPQEKADQILAKNGVERKPLSQFKLKTRDEAPEGFEIGPFKRRPKNVILISVESLSAEYLGTYGNKENLTPYLDALAKESLVFDKLFAIGTRTVRGLDALSIAAPPIPGQAIVRREHNTHLATLGELLEAQGYSTYFVYGGYGMFDNMNAYFKGNDYKVVDRTDFDKRTIQAENVWGVDDESLFSNALKMLDENTVRQKPFFAHIMTTSNHRPFTFPEGKIDLPQGHRAGAVKYTDYAIHQLIEQAKTKPWFKDTLFVIVADHCASVAGKTKLPVEKYHIPLFFYAPDMLPAGHYNRMVSQIDIVPTILDLLGAEGADRFFGQAFFEEPYLATPRAFISNYQELGYYKNNSLTVLSPKQKAEAYKIDPTTYEATPAPIDPALLDEAIAYYQTASRAFKQGKLGEFSEISP